jgi:hypothetical protein
MIYLQHISGRDADTQILKDGYLRPGYKTGVFSMYGRPGSRWVYVCIPIFKHQWANYYIDPMCLLTTRFVLHERWYSEDNIDPKTIIDGRTLTPTKLKNILKKYRERCLHNYLNKKKALDQISNYILEDEYKNINDRMVGLHEMTEILIEEDIDLRMYLRKVNYGWTCKKLTRSEQKLHTYILNEYPKVKIECSNE